MNASKYPFSPKSNAFLKPGDFWAIPLQDGSYACGRVLQIPKAGGHGSKVSFVGGLMDWHSPELPSEKNLDGSKVLSQGIMHIMSITKTGGEILGNRSLEKDSIEVQPKLTWWGWNMMWLKANREFLGLALDGQSEPSHKP